MDIFRTTTKHLRFSLQKRLLEEMTMGASRLEECMLGNIMMLRNDMAQRELNEYIREQTSVRGEEHSFMFREMYGEENLTTEWKTSELLNEAANWMIDNDIHGSFHIEAIVWEYRQDYLGLPLIKGFTVRGDGVMKNVVHSFGALK